jgi:hypothetical protein
MLTRRTFVVESKGAQNYFGLAQEVQAKVLIEIVLEIPSHRCSSLIRR